METSPTAEEPTLTERWRPSSSTVTLAYTRPTGANTTMNHPHRVSASLFSDACRTPPTLASPDDAAAADVGSQDSGSHGRSSHTTRLMRFDVSQNRYVTTDYCSHPSFHSSNCVRYSEHVSKRNTLVLFCLSFFHDRI